MRNDLGKQWLPEVVAFADLRTSGPPHHRFTYVLLKPFRVFVTVNVPSERAEILM